MSLSTPTLDLYSVIFAAANESSDVQASLRADVDSFVATAQNVSEIFKLITAKVNIINDPSLSATWDYIYTEHQSLRTSYKDHSSTVVAFVNKLVASGLPIVIDETKPDNVKLIILGAIANGVEPLKAQSAKLLNSSQSVSSGLAKFSQRLDEITNLDGGNQKLIDVAILAIDLNNQFHELQKKIYSLDNAVALGIVGANTTNGLFLQYLSSIFAVIYGQGRDSAIWTKFVKDLYVDKYVSQDLAFRTDLFQQGKKYSQLPAGLPVPVKSTANATKGGIDIGSHIWDEITKDTNGLIDWIKNGSQEEATPIIITLYKEHGKKTVYDNLVNSLRTFVSQG